MRFEYGQGTHWMGRLLLYFLPLLMMLGCSSDATSPPRPQAAKPTSPVVLVGNPARGPDDSPTSSGARPSGQAGSAPLDCARYEGVNADPDPGNLTPGQRFRAEWKFTNCGSSNWNGYRAVRSEGQFGPVAIPIQNWPPGTSGQIWI